MADILTVTRGLPSLVYPSVELARRLAAAGHRVTFAGDPETAVLAAGHGLDFQALEPDGFPEFARADAALSVRDRFSTLAQRRERGRDALGVGSFAASIRDRRPALVLINGEMHAHIIAAASTGVRVALLNSFASIWRQPGVPPPHHMARPGVGWRGSRIGASLLWSNLALRRWRRRQAALVRQVGCDRVSVLQHLARDAGFDFSGETDRRQWLMPFTYRRIPVLSLHALEFEFSDRPPAHVHYVGPMILRDRPDRPLSEADGQRLDAIIARRRDSPGGRRLVYASFGSTMTADVALLRRLAGIVADRPGWELILSVSGRLPVAALDPLPERVHAFAWVPQMSVLAHTDVAVTHGGINSVDECVMSAVPMLIYCGGETDMAGTTSRVVHHGIGIAGDRRRDGIAEMRAHVDRLIADGGVRDRICRLRQACAAYVETRAAERAVESLLAAQQESCVGGAA